MLQFVMRFLKSYSLAPGIRLVVVASLTGLGALPYSQDASASSSRWDHAGSIVRLLAYDSSRLFFYETVGPEANASSVEAGSILFEGRRSGNRYEGLAHIYSAGCGMLTYEVSGPIGADQRELTVSGEAPVLDKECRVVGSINQSLTFHWKENVQERSDDSYPEIPDYASLRMYFVEKNNMSTLILDVKDSRIVTGELLDHNGNHIAQVNGENSEPRTIALNFTPADENGLSGSGTYRYVADSLDSTLATTLDAGSPPRFPSRLQRITGGGDLPSSFELCSDECGIWRYGERIESLEIPLDWKGDRFTSPQSGILCIETREEKLNELVQLLAIAEIPQENYCGDTQWTDKGTIKDGLHTLRVPIGLERWAIEKLSTVDGVASADYAFGPTGGSGLAAITIGEGVLLPIDFPPDVSREDIEARWSESSCKIRTIFENKFRNVKVDHCRNDDGTLDNGFCFSVVLEGHTSEAQGFASANLAPNIDDKFLVRSQLIFDVAQVRSKKSPSGFVERLSYLVVESKFARQPESDSVASAVYRDIEHFQLGRSDGDVDEQIFGIAQQLVMASSFECASK